MNSINLDKNNGCSQDKVDPVTDMEKYREAVERDKKVLAADPNNANALKNAFNHSCVIAHKTNDSSYIDFGISCGEKYIQIKPDDAEMYYLFGCLYRSNLSREFAPVKDNSKAVAYYKKFLEFNTHDLKAAFAYNNLGVIYGEYYKDYKMAVEYIRKALVIIPNNATMIKNLETCSKQLSASNNLSVNTTVSKNNNSTDSTTVSKSIDKDEPRKVKKQHINLLKMIAEDIWSIIAIIITILWILICLLADEPYAKAIFFFIAMYNFIMGVMTIFLQLCKNNPDIIKINNDKAGRIALIWWITGSVLDILILVLRIRSLG